MRQSVKSNEEKNRNVNTFHHVRFTPESGHVRCNGPCLICANSGLFCEFRTHARFTSENGRPCVYRKPKPERNDDEARQGSGVIRSSLSAGQNESLTHKFDAPVPSIRCWCDPGSPAISPMAPPCRVPTACHRGHAVSYSLPCYSPFRSMRFTALSRDRCVSRSAPVSVSNSTVWLADARAISASQV